MSDDKKKDFVDSTFRKKWDREYYEQRAKDRDAGLLGDNDALDSKSKKLKVPVPTENLALFKAREDDLNLDKRIGKSNVVSGVTPASQQGGFYCDLCECMMKDSVAWLDHVNGKKHNRLQGNSMRVAKSSLDQVRDRLKAKKEEVATKKSMTEADKKKKQDEDYNAMLRAIEEKEEAARLEKLEQKRLKREEMKQQRAEVQSTTSDGDEEKDKGPELVEEEIDEEQAALIAMGLPANFGSSKKNK
eukprot:gene13689-16127_t